jgi:hypothetical protein
MLTLADKISLALCYADHQQLEDYLSHFGYDSSVAVQLKEGVNFFNLGQRFYNNFSSCGFTTVHLSELLIKTNCNYRK